MRRPERHRGRVTLDVVYRRLSRALGPQHWWPARTPFEVMVGAILTQATSWHNVERAIGRLRRARALTPRGLLAQRRTTVERCVRPSGYFRQKTQRLLRYTRWYLRRYRGEAARMFRTPLRALRGELMRQRGIGPETADSILLYAGAQPIFVVDAYTRRIFRRHRLLRGHPPYGEVQQFVMDRMARDARRYNEFHALLVEAGKRYCHRCDPDCAHCPLGDLPRTLERTTHGNR